MICKVELLVHLLVWEPVATYRANFEVEGNSAPAACWLPEQLPSHVPTDFLLKLTSIDRLRISDLYKQAHQSIWLVQNDRVNNFNTLL